MFYLFLLFPFFKPSFFTTIPIINKIYNLFQILNFLIIILFTLKERKISKINLLISGFIILLIISTIFNNGNLEEAIILGLKVISLCFLVDYGIKKNTKEFLKAFELLLSLLIYINFISLFLYPSGMYVNLANGYKSNWFLGFKNSHVLYILPAVLISIINSNIEKEKLSLRTLILIIISFLSVLVVKSSTSIVAMIMLILFLMFKKIIKSHNFNLKNYLIYYLIAFFSIIIFRIQNIFKFIIVDFLGKDLTFTGRIYIWDYVINRIKMKPIIGYGVEYKNYLFSIEKYPYYYSHNAILEILKQTGLIGLTLMAIILITIIKKLNQYKSEIITKTISFVIFIYLIMMLMETYDFEYYFFLFPLCYNIEYLIKAKKEVKTNEKVLI
jgi:O-antigen ligase